MKVMMMPSEHFQAYLLDCQQRVNQALEQRLPAATAPAERLKSAMRYSVQNGGKRVRATLVYASAEALGCCSEANCPNHSILDDVACALEFIHAYSLIHDDLPAMDDDALRRGQPTCHIAYDEATAILAGDALQALAFELLTRVPVSAELRLALIAELTKASGYRGMVGGQALDIEAENLEGENRTLNLAELEQIHCLKTGALIRAAIQMGALVAKADSRQLTQLDQYASSIGLAFQVTDDILDVEGDTATLGKTAGADEALHKSTYPALLGLAAAKQKAANLHVAALDSLTGFGPSAEKLRQLSAYIVKRNR